MGMSIDEAILYMKFYKRKLFDWFHRTDREAFETAIETMRNYQKIEEIVQHWIDEDLASESPSFADSGTIEDIIEVIEDGKTD
jgi:hypothetical protein